MCLASASLIKATNSLTEINFNAQPGISKIDLIWVGVAEEEVNTYTIERSKDGELWAEILTVDHIAKSNGNEKYFESDFHPITGISFYRLKKKLNNGLIAYSHIITVKNNQVIHDDGTISNPDVELINKDFSAYNNEEILVALKDNKGDEYFSRVYVIESNNETVLVDVDAKLLPGNYIITSCSVERLVSVNAVIK